eukprot:Gb_02066 [translate_table: standard]
MALAFAATTTCTSCAPKLHLPGSRQYKFHPQILNTFGIYGGHALWTPKLQYNLHINKVRTSIPQQTVCKAIQPKITDYEHLPSNSNPGHQTVQGLFQWSAIKVSALIFVSFVLSATLFCAKAFASTDSIKASGIGLKIASFMRRSGCPDEAIVFILATLPVLELRGAIPVGYWMQLEPLKISILSILGNMVPVPFILLYLKRVASFLGKRIPGASTFLDRLFERTRKKAGPIEEFQWLGLMLFVAVPFPGTGAWTGAIAAAILDMPFWEAVSANFFGVVFAGLLVNLLVNLGLKYAIIVGAILFFVSTIMWTFLRVASDIVYELFEYAFAIYGITDYQISLEFDFLSLIRFEFNTTRTLHAARMALAGQAFCQHLMHLLVQNY